MAKFKKREVLIDAEPWFKGKKIDGVIEEKFVPSGHWQDRFNDHPDVYMKTPLGNREVKEGYWIITDDETGERYPLPPEIFHKIYEPVKD